MTPFNCEWLQNSHNINFEDIERYRGKGCPSVDWQFLSTQNRSLYFGAFAGFIYPCRCTVLLVFINSEHH